MTVSEIKGRTIQPVSAEYGGNKTGSQNSQLFHIALSRDNLTQIDQLYTQSCLFILSIQLLKELPFRARFH